MSTPVDGPVVESPKGSFFFAPHVEAVYFEEYYPDPLAHAKPRENYRWRAIVQTISGSRHVWQSDGDDEATARTWAHEAASAIAELS